MKHLRWTAKILKWRSAIYIRLWWLDVIYPFVLSAILFAGLTYLIYNGQKHRRLASQMEEKFIGFSLRVASPRSISKVNQIVTVNLREVDLKYLPHVIRSNFIDVSPEIYAKILEKLFKMEVRYIVLSWRQAMNSDRESWAKLEKTLNSIPAWTRVTFAVPANIKKTLPEFILENAIVVDNAPCQPGTQLMCMYGAHWDDWIIQTIANDFWLDRDFNTSEDKISFNLPRTQPSYLLYLNSTSDFESFTFSQLLFLDDFTVKLKDKAVFIGNDLPQGKPGMSQADDILKVATALTSSTVEVRTHGTPFHRYWAQIAQLFTDHDLIEIIPYQWSLTIAILFAAFIIFFLNIFGAPVALGLFLSCTAIAPLLNALAIALWRVYMPIFDLIYAGFWSFIAVTFGQLSMDSFRSWQLGTQEQTYRDAIDSKTNFISLISHNLNTPVAKMQGLFEILTKMPIDAQLQIDAAEARREATRIQLIIRSALVLTALEDHNLSHTPLSAVSIAQEFRNSVGTLLARIGINVAVSVSRDDSNLVDIPLRFDKRALCTAIGAIVLVGFETNKLATEYFLELSVREDVESSGLSVRLFFSIKTRVYKYNDQLVRCLTSHFQNTKELHQLNEPTTLQELSINLFRSLMANYDGRLETRECSKAFEISITPSQALET